MASDIQDELMDIFEQLTDVSMEDAGMGIGGPEADSAAFNAEATGDAGDGAVPSPADAAGAASGNTRGTAAAQSGGSGVLGTLESAGMDVVKSAFGLSPIIGGLISLFGGGSSSPPPLVRYQMPDAIQYEGADVDGAIEGGDFGQAGEGRGYGASMGGAAAIPGITLNVQAMDAQSFLDRSSDIAAAVKQAMLNLNSINDVVSDL